MYILLPNFGGKYLRFRSMRALIRFLVAKSCTFYFPILGGNYIRFCSVTPRVTPRITPRVTPRVTPIVTPVVTPILTPIVVLRLFLFRSTLISKVCWHHHQTLNTYTILKLIYRIFGHDSVPIRDQSGSLGRNLEQPRHGHYGQFGPPICRLHEIFRRRCAPKDK